MVPKGPKDGRRYTRLAIRPNLSEGSSAPLRE